MITFRQFIEDASSKETGLFANIPGNPAFGGKKPSDGNGKNPYLNNKPVQANAAGGMPQQPPPKMMKKN